MKSIELPPNPSALIESTRAIGYDAPSAVADIIDNSIAASASSVDLFYDPFDSPHLAILDDGSGMSSLELQKAMRYGSTAPGMQRDEKDLGRYGMGLKTASLSQCRRLTVVSWQNGRLAGCRWDINEIEKRNDWILGVLEENDLSRIPYVDKLTDRANGTLVLWEDLDRMMVDVKDPTKAMAGKMDRVREHLGLVFHRYIKGEAAIKPLVIRMNGVRVKPADPFLTSRSDLIMDEERIRVGSSFVRIRPYVLPHKSKLTEEEIQMLGGKESFRTGQGFYVYRNKRLVVWGTWFRLTARSDLTDLARVQIDIPNDLDNLWTLDIKKSTASPPENVRNGLKRIIEAITKRSIRVYETRGRREVGSPSDREKFWIRVERPDHTVHYEINRMHPLIQHIFTEDPKNKGRLEILFRNIEDALPLQQLHVERESGASHIANADPIDEEEMQERLVQILDHLNDDRLCIEFLENIEYSEPFCDYPAVVAALKEVHGGKYAQNSNIWRP